MNKLSKTLFIGIGMSLLSCGQAERKEISQVQSNQTEEVEKVQVSADRVLNLEIDGMVCKMGCGGSIRKELNGTDAIADVDFDFSEDRTTNFAKVYFDKDKIDVNQIVDLISNINDGQFNVRSTGSEAYSVENEITEKLESSNSEQSKVNAISTNLEVPNIFELITQYLI